MNQDKELRQQWEDISFDAVGLWRHLLRWDYWRAAKGLLLDLFKELSDAEKHPEDHPDTMLDGTKVNDHLVALYRERLMEILDDADGQKLGQWQKGPSKNDFQE